MDVRGGLASVQTSNVATFSFKPNISKVNGLDIDGITLALNSVNVGTGYVRLQRTYTGSWQVGNSFILSYEISMKILDP